MTLKNNITVIATVAVIASIFLYAGCASRPRTPVGDAAHVDTAVAAVAQPSFAPVPSIINIPIEITTRYIENLIDSLLPNRLYAGDIAAIANFGTVSVVISKGGRVRARAHGSELRYTVPLRINMRVTIGGALFGGISQEAEAALNVNLRTRIRVNNNWSLTTTTTTDGYNWTREPVVRTPIAEIPLRQAGDFIMQSAIGAIGQSIDNAIARGVNVRAIASPFWRELQTPIRAAMPAVDGDLWLRILPSEIFVTTPIGHGDVVIASFGVRAIVEAFIGERPAPIRVTALPDFVAPPDRLVGAFTINLFPQFTFEQATALCRAALVGETFRSGVHRVRVNDVTISARDGLALVTLDVTGSLTGIIRLTGRAVYDARAQVISLEDFDFDIETKSRFMSARNWFVRGIIMARMRPHLRFPLKEKLAAAREAGQQTLSDYKLPHGFVLNGQIDDIAVRGVEVGADAFRVAVLATGSARVAAGR